MLKTDDSTQCTRSLENEPNEKQQNQHEQTRGRRTRYDFPDRQSSNSRSKNDEHKLLERRREKKQNTQNSPEAQYHRTLTIAESTKEQDFGRHHGNDLYGAKRRRMSKITDGEEHLAARCKEYCSFSWTNNAGQGSRRRTEFVIPKLCKCIQMHCKRGHSADCGTNGKGSFLLAQWRHSREMARAKNADNKETNNKNIRGKFRLGVIRRKRRSEDSENLRKTQCSDTKRIGHQICRKEDCRTDKRQCKEFHCDDTSDKRRYRYGADKAGNPSWRNTDIAVYPKIQRETSKSKLVRNLVILSINLTGYEKSIVNDIINQADQKPDIVCLQETFTYQNPRLNLEIQGYTTFHKSSMPCDKRQRGRPYGGLITYISDKLLQPSEVAIENNRILSVRIGKCAIANVYLPYDGHHETELYDRCLADLDGLMGQSDSTIIVGDCNPTGNNSQAFKAFMCENDLKYDKSVTFTFIEPVQSNTSLLDFIIVQEGNGDINSSTIDDSVNKGGHLPLMGVVTLTDPSIFNPNPKSSIGPDSIRRKIRHIPQHIPKEFYHNVTKECIDMQLGTGNVTLTNLEKTIQSTIDKFWPEKIERSHLNGNERQGKKRNIKFFPTREKREKDEAYKQWQRMGQPTKNHPCSLKLREKTRLFRSAMRWAKAQHRSYEASQYLQSGKKLKGNIKTFWADKVEHAEGAEQIADMWKNKYSSDELNEVYTCLRYDLQDQFIFTETNVLEAIRDLPLDKVYDTNIKGITPKMYDDPLIASILAEKFTEICQQKERLTEFESPFKFYLRPTLKQNGLAKGIAKSYRPIAISGIILVIYERVIYNFIEPLIEEILPDSCYAYRKKRSCSLAILRLKELLRRKGATVCFLDASDAFGSVKWDAMYDILEKHGFSRNIITMIKQLYRNSYGRIRWDTTESSTFALSKGVRQGGSISGLLFNLYMNELLASKVNDWAEILIYADDIALVTFHPFAMYQTIEFILASSNHLNIRWNPSKCKILTRDFKSPRQKIQMLGQSLEYVSCYKYLGWIITRKISNEDDEQAASQIAKLYINTHQVIQAYGFIFKLPRHERVCFCKMYGNIYAAEAYTSLSRKMMTKLRGAHRYLYMKILSWRGIRKETNTGTEIDCRSRWLYAVEASKKSSINAHYIQIPAPTIEMQMRMRNYKIRQTSKLLKLNMDLSMLYNKCLKLVQKKV